jgi:micrococcal nuclease
MFTQPTCALKYQYIWCSITQLSTIQVVWIAVAQKSIRFVLRNLRAVLLLANDLRMKPLANGIILPTWLPLCLLMLASTSVVQAEEFYAKVIGVTDGDTITVLHDGIAERIRLVGIDAPESRQAYGGKAKQFVAKQVYGKQVLINCSGNDRYGRTLGEIFLPDGNSVNQLLLREGFAWVYRKYSNDPILYLLEANARQRRTGLWFDSSAIPPWEFRHGTVDTANLKSGTPLNRKVRKRRTKQPIG